MMQRIIAVFSPVPNLVMSLVVPCKKAGCSANTKTPYTCPTNTHTQRTSAGNFSKRGTKCIAVKRFRRPGTPDRRLSRGTSRRILNRHGVGVNGVNGVNGGTGNLKRQRLNL
jgi:hypothetical protein